MATDSLVGMLHNWVWTAKDLTHWGWVTHIYLGKLTIIGSDNDLSPDRHQAITWTNGGIMLIGPSGKISIKFNQNATTFIQENAFENVIWKITAILSRPQYIQQTSSALFVAWCQSGQWQMWQLGWDVLILLSNVSQM